MTYQRPVKCSEIEATHVSSLLLSASFARVNTNQQQCEGRVITQEVSRWLPAAAARVPKPGSSHVGFVVDKVALGQVFSEYFGFPCQSSFHQFLHNHHHLSITWGWYNRPVVAEGPRASVSLH
jgi:hypothetical protein